MYQIARTKDKIAKNCCEFLNFYEFGILSKSLKMAKKAVLSFGLRPRTQFSKCGRTTFGLLRLFSQK
jgi:hypothetical protein